VDNVPQPPEETSEVTTGSCSGFVFITLDTFGANAPLLGEKVCQLAALLLCDSDRFEDFVGGAFCMKGSDNKEE
jgi:hypothetical protein